MLLYYNLTYEANINQNIHLSSEKLQQKLEEHLFQGCCLAYFYMGVKD